MAGQAEYDDLFLAFLFCLLCLAYRHGYRMAGFRGDDDAFGPGELYGRFVTFDLVHRAGFHQTVGNRF